MAITRQLIFAIDPYSSEQYINTFSFADIPDGNAVSKAFTCGIVPHARTSGVSLMQESVFLGTTSAAGKTFQAFKDTLALDGSTEVTATAVLQRIDPDARSDDARSNGDARNVTQKRFLNINFAPPSPFVSDIAIDYCLDGDPTTGDPVSWTSFLGVSGDTKLSFDGARGGFCYIRITDTSMRYNVIGFPPFSLEYVSDGPEREGGNK